MRKLILSTAIVFAAAAGAFVAPTSANAANERWCATTGGENSATLCDFQSRQQCQAFVSGRGGQCDENFLRGSIARSAIFSAFAQYGQPIVTDMDYRNRP